MLWRIYDHHSLLRETPSGTRGRGREVAAESFDWIFAGLMRDRTPHQIHAPTSIPQLVWMTTEPGDSKVEARSPARRVFPEVLGSEEGKNIEILHAIPGNFHFEKAN